MDGTLITDLGAVTASGLFEDILLDSLSVVQPSRARDLTGGLTAVRQGGSGLLIVVAGRLSAAAARQLAASRGGGGEAIALLLAVSTWSGQGARDREHGPERRNGNGDGNGNGNGNGAEPDGARAAALSSGPVTHAETAEAAAILTRAGWHVVSVDSATPLTSAWRRLSGAGLAARAAAASDQPGAMR